MGYTQQRAKARKSPHQEEGNLKMDSNIKTICLASCRASIDLCDPGGPISPSEPWASGQQAQPLGGDAGDGGGSGTTLR